MLYGLLIYWIICSAMLVYAYKKDKGMTLIPEGYMLAFLIVGGGALAPWLGLAMLFEKIDKFFKPEVKRAGNYYGDTAGTLILTVVFAAALMNLEVAGIQEAKAREAHETALSAECSCHKPYSCDLPDYLK